MNPAAANSPALEPIRPLERSWLAGPKPPGEGWSATRWAAVLLIAFAVHVGFIMTLAEKKTATPRVVTNVPKLTLADGSDELLELNNPTLFALPQQRDFPAGSGLKTNELKSPSFRWTEPPRWLPLSETGLGSAVGEFLQTNSFAKLALDFKPSPELSTPALPLEPVLAQNSTMQVEGKLAQRVLPFEMSLTNWPYPDVLAPCVVQVLVNPAGNVISAVVLPPEDGLVAGGHYDVADQHALELARTLRFKPAPQPTVGRIIFNWHTVPPATTTNGHE
jgi:hypothetical protein